MVTNLFLSANDTEANFLLKIWRETQFPAIKIIIFH